MSGGVIIDIPNLGRSIIPFSPFDNNEFNQALELRYNKSKRIQSTSFKDALKKDPNFHIINAIVVPFIDYLKDEHKKEDHHTEALFFAGEIVRMVKHAQMCDHSDYCHNLLRLQRALRKSKMNYMEAGTDQIIARLLFILRFEDPIRVWDYYALWVEDFGGDNGEGVIIPPENCYPPCMLEETEEGVNIPQQDS